MFFIIVILETIVERSIFCARQQCADRNADLCSKVSGNEVLQIRSLFRQFYPAFRRKSLLRH